LSFLETALGEITIRDYRWSDVPAITAIYRHAVENTVATFDTEPPGETFFAEKFGRIRDLRHPLLIADHGGQCVGYAYASTYRPRPAYRFTCENSVYVAPEMQGKGIGTRLMVQLLEECRAFGFKQVIAVIAAERADSVHLHQKLGFVHAGLHPRVGFKFDRWLDIVHMQLAL
jgi:phosphinothricin acetyltransferase